MGRIGEITTLFQPLVLPDRCGVGQMDMVSIGKQCIDQPVPVVRRFDDHTFQFFAKRCQHGADLQRVVGQPPLIDDVVHLIADHDHTIVRVQVDSANFFMPASCASRRCRNPDSTPAALPERREANDYQSRAMSWYGFSRAWAPSAPLSMPAIGLVGWLAHLPYRPADMPRHAWRGQLNGWLLEDLATSAWIWSRIALFMRARGTYLLDVQLARPCELAALRATKARL